MSEKQLNATTLAIIQNAVGFAYINHTQPERIERNDEGVLAVDVTDEEVALSRAIAKAVYVTFAESGVLSYE
jgi:hypothetical protein